MEYYKICINRKIDIIDIDSLNLSDIIAYRGNCLYVYKDDKLYGIIGKKEHRIISETGKLLINTQYKYINTEDVGEARCIFGDEPTFRALPYVNDKHQVEFEFTWSREDYYTEAVISNGLNEEEREDHIVVSMTSHGKRLEYVYIAIKSIMLQKMKADEIVLYLDETSNGRQIECQEELVNAGLRIVSGKENLKGHCKYYYAMEEYEDSIIITIDDDIIYPDNLIEDLYTAHKRFPDTVIAHRAHKAFDDYGKELKVVDYGWEVYGDKPEKTYCATGVGGILYPIGDYRRAFLNREVIKKCCLNADDIWLMYIEAMVKKRVFAMMPIKLREIKGSQMEPGLSIGNDLCGENQLWLENLESNFGKKLQDLVCDEY